MSHKVLRDSSGPEPIQILLVDDEKDIRSSLTHRLSRRGHRIDDFESGLQAVEAARTKTYHVALVDMKMEGMDGLAVLEHLKAIQPLTQVIMITGHGTVESAIQAMKLGAYDYLQKPFEAPKLDLLLEKAYDKWKIASYAQELEGKIAHLNRELKGRYDYHNIVGRSPVMLDVFRKVEASGQNNSTVMIVGESGTGKELVARAIHYGGALADKPFIPINCAALPRELIESELFGYKKGSFTSANADSTGLFKAAEGGTIFLDEVTEMALETQAKLLRVLQEKAIRPVGHTKEIPINVRIITSSNRDLKQAVKEGALREDLYYRLSVATIRIPPLRERHEDIPILIRAFLDKFNARGGRQIQGVDTRALSILIGYTWPGNVRELENMVESAYAFGQGPLLTISDLPPHLDTTPPVSRTTEFPFADVMPIREAERLLMIRALEKFNGNKARAAQALGMSRKQFYVKLEAYSIDTLRR